MDELRLLGGTEFCGAHGGDTAAVFAHPKRFALLAYLAAARPFGWHRRDTLVGLLWPDLDQDHGRAALRKSVHRLRHALGAATIGSRGDESIAISPSTLWCDARAFDEALVGGRPADAVALYRGDFLPGLFVAHAPEFEQWVERERDDLRRRAAQAAARASELAERAGQIAQCTDLARHASQLAPHDEQVLRRLIVLLDRAGDRAGALRVYESFERRLATDLQVMPSSDTQSLIAAIRSEAIPMARSVLPVPAAQDGPAAHVDQSPAAEGASASHPSATHLSPPETPPHRRPRALWLGTLVVAIGLAVVSIAPRYARVDARLDEAGVAVFALENETGRPDLAFVGNEVQDWITRGLQETGLVRVFPVDTRTGTRVPDVADLSADSVRRRARDLGAATLIRGRYYLRRDSIHLQVSIIGVRDGDVVAALPSVVGPIGDPTAAIDQLRRRTIGVLATHVDSAFNQWARAASQPPSFEAYRAFAEGRQALNRDDYAGAVDHYLRAAALDSTYILPMLMAAELKGSGLGDMVGEDSLLRAARRRSAAFAPFDEAYASVLEAQRHHDFERAFVEAQRIRRYVAPGGEYDLNAAAAAVAVNRPREAVKLVRGVDLHRRPILDHWDNFVPIGNAYHLAGENAALLGVLRTDAMPWRHIPLIVVQEMQALAGLSRASEVAPVWRRLLGQSDDDAVAGAMWAAWNGARELRAHGSVGAARALAAEALDSFPTVPVRSVHFGDPLALERELLREAGRLPDASRIAQAIVAKHPGRRDAIVAAAVIAAQLGDSAAARRVEVELAGSPVMGDWGVWLERARLAAALGRPDSAVARLHELCDHGCAIFEDLHIVFEFDGLRSYPPFQALLRPRR